MIRPTETRWKLHYTTGPGLQFPPERETVFSNRHLPIRPERYHQSTELALRVAEGTYSWLLPSMYAIASPTVVNFSAASSGISEPNSSSRAMTSST